MPQDLEATIRERAYHLWVADGCRDGASEHHWLAAEREVLAAFAATAPASKGTKPAGGQQQRRRRCQGARKGAPPRLGP